MISKLFSFVDNKKKYYITFSIFFLITAYFTFLGLFTTFPIVAAYGRGLLLYLPTILTLNVPLFTLIMLHLFKSKNNVANRFKVLKVYSLSLICVMSLCLLIHVFDIFYEFKWNRLYGSFSYLFPFDILFFICLFLALGIFLFVQLKKNSDLSKIIKTTPEMKKKTLVLHVFCIMFASYFLGLFYSYFYTFGNLITENIIGGLAVLFTFLFLSVEIFSYCFYQNKKNDKTYFLSLLITGLFLIFISVWVLISYCLHPYLFSESLEKYFYIGYALTFPLGFFINLAFSYILLFVAIIKFIIKIRKDKSKNNF